MTFKPNPGCDIPLSYDFPGVENLLADIGKDVLKKLTTPTGALEVAARAKETAETIKEIVQAQTDAIKRREAQLKKYVSIVCPLPDVIDKKATG